MGIGIAIKFWINTSKLNFNWADTGIINEFWAFFILAYFFIEEYCSFALLFFITASILFWTMIIFFDIVFSLNWLVSFSSLIFNFSSAATKSKAPSEIIFAFNNKFILIFNSGLSIKDIWRKSSNFVPQVLHFSSFSISLLNDL